MFAEWRKWVIPHLKSNFRPLVEDSDTKIVFAFWIADQDSFLPLAQCGTPRWGPCTTFRRGLWEKNIDTVKSIRKLGNSPCGGPRQSQLFHRRGRHNAGWGCFQPIDCQQPSKDKTNLIFPYTGYSTSRASQTHPPPDASLCQLEIRSDDDFHRCLHTELGWGLRQPSVEPDGQGCGTDAQTTSRQCGSEGHRAGPCASFWSGMEAVEFTGPKDTILAGVYVVQVSGLIVLPNCFQKQSVYSCPQADCWYAIAVFIACCMTKTIPRSCVFVRSAV